MLTDMQMYQRVLRLIGVGRFRILRERERGGGGGARGPNSQQAHDIVTTSMSCAHKIFNKSVPNNYISHLKI